MRPQPHPRPSWPSNDDTAGFNLIVILVGVCLGAYLVWTNYHGTISTAVMAVMRREILLIDHFTHRFDMADQQMAAADPNGVTLRDLYGIAQAVGMSSASRRRCSLSCWRRSARSEPPRRATSAASISMP